MVLYCCCTVQKTEYSLNMLIKCAMSRKRERMERKFNRREVKHEIEYCTQRKNDDLREILRAFPGKLAGYDRRIDTGGGDPPG